MIAEDVSSTERHQRVHGSLRIERAARHIAEIDDLANALRADVGQHGFQREIISVHIGNRGKAHVSFSFRQVQSYGRRSTVLVSYLIWVKPARNILLWLQDGTRIPT